MRHLRTLSARLITRYDLGPRTCSGVQIRAWAWLAAKTSNLAEKERCLETILTCSQTPHCDPDLRGD
jgi:hypothetical protein